MKKSLAIWIVVTVLAVMAFHCSRHKNEAMQKLGDFTLEEAVTGKEAREVIARLHLGVFEAKDYEVFYYKKDDQNATLYRSYFSTQAEADTMVNRMAVKIGAGNFGFFHHMEVPLRDIRLHFTMGQGQIHYFYSKDKAVIWLTAPTEAGSLMLSQLLQIPQDEIKSAVMGTIHKGMNIGH